MTATILRPLTGRLEIRNLRGSRGDEPTNREMLRAAGGYPLIRPAWVEAESGKDPWMGYWTVSRSHLSAIAAVIAIRDGEVLIKMHYSTAERCDERCQRAQGDDCTCSCQGKNHGAAEHASWTPVGQTTLVRSGGTRVVTRRLTREQALDR